MIFSLAASRLLIFSYFSLLKQLLSAPFMQWSQLKISPSSPEVSSLYGHHQLFKILQNKSPYTKVDRLLPILKRTNVKENFDFFLADAFLQYHVFATFHQWKNNTTRAIKCLKYPCAHC